MYHSLSVSECRNQEGLISDGMAAKVYKAASSQTLALIVNVPSACSQNLPTTMAKAEGISRQGRFRTACSLALIPRIESPQEDVPVGKHQLPWVALTNRYVISPIPLPPLQTSKTI